MKSGGKSPKSKPNARSRLGFSSVLVEEAARVPVATVGWKKAAERAAMAVSESFMMDCLDRLGVGLTKVEKYSTL